MSWSRRSVIRCCWGCVAPRRHIGCHGTCPDYAAENNQKLEEEHLTSNTFISAVEFDKRQGAGQKRTKE